MPILYRSTTAKRPLRPQTGMQNMQQEGREVRTGVQSPGITQKAGPMLPGGKPPMEPSAPKLPPQGFMQDPNTQPKPQGGAPASAMALAPRVQPPGTQQPQGGPPRQEAPGQQQANPLANVQWSAPPGSTQGPPGGAQFPGAGPQLPPSQGGPAGLPNSLSGIGTIHGTPDPSLPAGYDPNQVTPEDIQRMIDEMTARALEAAGGEADTTEQEALARELYLDRLTAQQQADSARMGRLGHGASGALYAMNADLQRKASQGLLGDILDIRDDASDQAWDRGMQAAQLEADRENAANMSAIIEQMLTEGQDGATKPVIANKQNFHGELDYSDYMGRAGTTDKDGNKYVIRKGHLVLLDPNGNVLSWWKAAPLTEMNPID